MQTTSPQTKPADGTQSAPVKIVLAIAHAIERGDWMTPAAKAYFAAKKTAK